MCIWKMLVSLGILVLLVACTAQAAEREQFIDGMQTWHGTWVENGLVWLDEPYDSKVQESFKSASYRWSRDTSMRRRLPLEVGTVNTPRSRERFSLLYS